MSGIPLPDDFIRHEVIPAWRGPRPSLPTPFIRGPRSPNAIPPGEFGLRVPSPGGAGPRFPWLGLLAAIDLVDTFVDTRGLHPTHRDLILRGMIRCDGPYYDPGPNSIGWFNIDFNAFHCEHFQLGGQALGPYWVGNLPGSDCDGCGPQFDLGNPGDDFWYPGFGAPPDGQTPPTAITYHVYCQPNLSNCTAHRGREHSSWYRETVVAPWGGQIRAPALPGTGPWEIPPNVHRFLPPDPPLMEPGVGTPLPFDPVKPDAQPAPWSPLVVDAPTVPVRWGIGIGTTVAPVAGASQDGAQPDQQPVVDPVKVPFEPTWPPAPPRAGEKEKKAQSRSAKLGRLLFKVLDDISENADVIDAIYKALPCSVQKRWNRGRRRGVDQFGQYGVNGADWKLQALWHNWHQLDASEAWQNVAWNALEDQIYGYLHRMVPRGFSGPAGSQAFKELDDLLKEIPLHQPKECPK